MKKIIILSFISILMFGCQDTTVQNDTPVESLKNKLEEEWTKEDWLRHYAEGGSHKDFQVSKEDEEEVLKSLGF